VRQSLPGADQERVEEELRDLGLAPYCRPRPPRGEPGE
jgi:hypothetical protein